jgi:hypothetical protein
MAARLAQKDKSGSAQAGQGKKFTKPAVCSAWTLRGGYAKKPLALKTFSHEGVEFAQLLRCDSGFNHFVTGVGKNGRGKTLKESEMWRSCVAQVRGKETKMEAAGKGDTFGANEMVVSVSNRRRFKMKKECRVPDTMEIGAIGDLPAIDVVVLLNMSAQDSELWVRVQDLTAFISRLHADFCSCLAEEEQEPLGEIQWRPGSNNWIIYWKDGGGNLLHESLRVDTRTYFRGSRCTKSAAAFLKAKASGRQKLLFRAKELGCNVLEDEGARSDEGVNEYSGDDSMACSAGGA